MCSPGVALVLSLAPVALRAQAPEGVGCDVRDAQRATRSRKEAGLKKKWCSERNAGRLAVRPMCNRAGCRQISEFASGCGFLLGSNIHTFNPPDAICRSFDREEA